MPPEEELKARVDFFYTMGNAEPDVDKYWKKAGKELNGQLEAYAGKKSAVEAAVAQIVSAGDSPETKLQKIYARVQQLLAQDLPYINLWYLDNVLVHSGRTSNFEVSPAGNYDFLNTVELH